MDEAVHGMFGGGVEGRAKKGQLARYAAYQDHALGVTGGGFLAVLRGKEFRDGELRCANRVCDVDVQRCVVPGVNVVFAFTAARRVPKVRPVGFNFTST